MKEKAVCLLDRTIREQQRSVHVDPQNRFRRALLVLRLQEIRRLLVGRPLRAYNANRPLFGRRRKRAA